MTILSIETSCDETAAAVTHNTTVISNVIHSQIAIHRKWGGVVPHLAKREHIQYIDTIINKALEKANKSWGNIDALAVTYGPGLAPALEVGINKAKKLAQQYQKPLIAVNHMEGHLLSSLAQPITKHEQDSLKKSQIFSKEKEKIITKNLSSNNQHSTPHLALLISGGHTEIVLMKRIGNYKIIGQTVDDAMGEAFDKVAKMLGLGYPGGPIIEQYAKKGDEQTFNFPIPMQYHKTLNMSFAGLKTACLYELRKTPEEKRDDTYISNFAASFQKAATQTAITKLTKALQKYKPKYLFLGGGVLNNQYVQNAIFKVTKEHNVQPLLPYDSNLLSDNAAMIGIAAYFKTERNEFVENSEILDRHPGLIL